MSSALTMHDDARATLTAHAERSLTRNTPRFFVLLAILALLAGAWYAWAGWRASKEARDESEAAQLHAQNTANAIGKLQALLERDAQPGAARANAPTSTLLSRIEALGPTAGLKKPVPLPNTTSNANPTKGWTQVKANYTLRDESMSAILQWANMVTEEVPGMEVHSITIRPEATEWLANIVFSRWEKLKANP